ncbi:hypothetical protein [Actinacidiphila rubida]|uniref:Lipoprotein n=1 Tax=Actinacidiphila rubida TaxID=310780 RepID=A0A1H8RAE8_9ACTN|nr:hypothetical protein [Actinacidiphila rubida]SEO63391.1 hypothetical protein SAMN05216267_103387 [Actinacidiphila rubida]SEP00376.1 hypothetical protein SAMN05216267_106813 [Actinacidiphila rubida]
MATSRSSLPGAWAVGVAAVALALSGCTSSGGSDGGGTPSGAASPTASVSATGSASAPGTRSPAGGGAGTVSLTLAANGTTVRLRIGQHVHVALATSYWTFRLPDAPAVLHQDATGSANPSPSVSCAAPLAESGGCGDRTADYTATAAGTSLIVATRTICGEAMRCTAASGHFQVRAVVG